MSSVTVLSLSDYQKLSWSVIPVKHSFSASSQQQPPSSPSIPVSQYLVQGAGWKIQFSLFIDEESWASEPALIITALTSHLVSCQPGLLSTSWGSDICRVLPRYRRVTSQPPIMAKLPSSYRSYVIFTGRSWSSTLSWTSWRKQYSWVRESLRNISWEQKTVNTR